MFGRFVTNALALAAAAFIIPGIIVTAPTTEGKIVTICIMALIFGVINSTVKPILQVLGFPFTVLTLGLFLVVINAAMLLLSSWIATQFGLGWHVSGFWPAIFGAIVVSVVSTIAGNFTESEGRR